ncbi:DUF4139 domain-containing protein [soil metagenome]
MNRRFARHASLFALATLAAAGFFAARAHADAPAVAALKSTAQQREEVGITIYNQNFGLVREVRTIELPTGRSLLEFRDVSERIQTETVSIKSLAPGGAAPLRVLEQNYRYDLLSPQKLLEKYVGKHVKVYRWNEKTGKDDEFDAEVLAAGQGTVLRINGEITYDFPGRIAFPQLPDNLISKPTLVWLLEGGGKQKIEVTYLTANLGWHADYVFTINENDTAGDLTGWITLNNTTGTAYENAKLKLVAGDVQRVRSEITATYHGAIAATKSSDSRQFQEEGFFEYHLYTLDRPTTLLNAEQKQVTLLEAQGVRVDKHLIFYGAQNYYRGQYGQVVSNQKVGVYLDLENKETNHMGMPLPKGIVRVYKAEKSGAKQFIGEDAIDHTPRDEKVRIKMGEAFDVVGDRKQTDYKILGSCTTESAWEISLRNHKDAPTAVEVYEPVGGDWEMVSSSIPSTKKDAHTFTFQPTIAARGEIKITYRVRVKWC